MLVLFRKFFLRNISQENDGHANCTVVRSMEYGTEEYNCSYRSCEENCGCVENYRYGAEDEAKIQVMCEKFGRENFVFGQIVLKTKSCNCCVRLSIHKEKRWKESMRPKFFTKRFWFHVTCICIGTCIYEHLFNYVTHARIVVNILEP